ncbi:protein translocase subunit SecA [Flavobacteriaceae bacterium UJ101]|nr:protein translocase subunit SecA [Flavobacteriaceae bacterium UJ101]
MDFVNNILKAILGDKSKKDLKPIQPLIKKANSFNYQNLSHDELRNKTLEFRSKIKEATQAQTDKIAELKTLIEEEKDIYKKDDYYNQIDALSKESYKIEEKVLNEILPEAFAVIKETARRFTNHTEIEVTASEFDRQLSGSKNYVSLVDDTKAVWKNSWDASGKEVTWDMVHYDVQLIGGTVLHQGKIAEMATGEGKTLVATLPVYLNALPGRGVHVITVNDYLAKRDCAWMAPIFQFHGLTIDCIDNHRPNSEERKTAYKCDIVYGTNNEFGFDYLRDNMAHSPKDLVQQELNYAIIDEVDSVLVDDARTPLIISGPVPKGGDQEFDALKPKIESLVKVQQALIKDLFLEAKKEMIEGPKKNNSGDFKLLQVYRGLPKYKPLLKYLNEEGTKTRLQKIEGVYLADNQREMHKVDADLFFTIEEKNNSIQLTDKGIDFLSQGVEDDSFFIMPDIATELSQIETLGLSSEEEGNKKDELFRDYSIKSERLHTMNQLLKAYTLFEKDVEYVVMDGKVMIVDEQTGRIMDGRRYSDGLHQAIEAKENVKIEDATQTYATITLQNYFRMYNKLSGMTGTAETEAGEFWEIYKLDVVTIPTNKPIARKDMNDLIYKTNREKYNAVISEVVRLAKEDKRPVLVGTTSVEISELLSRAMKMNKIEHNVLNAKLHKKEADIVAEAGRPGIVTIATNMAGRGTDIKISDEVKERGGLAIIGTERHDSRRVDRQLRGRSGRQGDVGSSQFYVSLEDKLMRLFNSERIAKLMDKMGHQDGDVIQSGMVTKSIEKAQKRVEENNFGVRKRLIEYDDVMNKQRDVIYKRRRHALEGERLSIDISNMVYDTVVNIVTTNKNLNDYKNFEYELIKFFTLKTAISEVDFKSKSLQTLIDDVYDEAMTHYEEREVKTAKMALPVIANVYEQQGDRFERIVVPFTDGLKTMNITTNLKEAVESEGKQLIRDFEKNVTLAMIDDQWKDHLREMDELKRSSQNASYEQKDPILIYKEEAFGLFRNMIDRLNKEIVSFLFKGELPTPDPEQVRQAEERKQEKLQTSHQSYEEQQAQATQTNAPKQQVQVTEPRHVVKINRNDLVKVRNVATGALEEMKFKKAEPLLKKGSHVLVKE